MIRTFAVVALLGWPQSWFGADKLKHFTLSAFVHSATFSLARAARIDRAASQWTAAGTTMTIGVLKEMHDRRSNKPFSVQDLLWDAAGSWTAASLLNGTR